MSDDASEPKTAKTIFVSYARDDAVRARTIVSALQATGYDVWWDELIEGGATYVRSISSALESADAIIVLWSPRSIESDWVRDEAAQGRDRHRLVPLSIEGAEPPLGFRQYQVIDISRWRGKADAPQFLAIQRAIEAAAGEHPLRVPATSPGASRRTVLAAGAAATAALAGGGAWFALSDRPTDSGDRQSVSIAVLPFATLGNASQAYFAEGLTDEIRTALTRIDALRVLAATSTSAVANETSGPKDIARKLGVDFLLNGSAQRQGELVKITVALVDGHSGFTKWSQSTLRSLKDIFVVQSEIAKTVAQAMSVHVATAVPAPGGTRNVAAYEHFLKGRALFNLARDEATDRTALAEFELAIAADPQFALAHAARSRSLAALAAEYAKADQLKRLYEQAIESARRAVALAPTLAEGHLALGYALFTGRLDVAAARPSYDRAYALGRGKADIVLLFALYCSRAGRAEEAIAAVKQAVALDPLNARAHRAEGSVDYAGRRFSDALPPLRRALELNPKMTFAHFLAGCALFGLGRLEEARKEFQAEPQPEFSLAGLAIVDRKLGDDAAADLAFAKLVETKGDSALYQQAQVLAQWGRAGDAVEALERARQVGDSGLIYLDTDPLLDPIRGEPRFAALARAIRTG